MKVLQINSVCGVGSTGRIAADIHRVLKQNGHESKIAYGRGEAKGVSSDDTIKIGTDRDIYAHVILSRLTDRTGFYSKSATKKLIRSIEEYNPDVIHLHNIHGYYINIKLLFDYLKKAGKPVVWTLHDCWAFTGHCTHFDYCGCEKWKTGCEKCPQLNRYPKSFADSSKRNYLYKKQIFNGINNMTIVTPSKWLENLVKQSYLGNYNIQVIYNGIDLTVFKPTVSDFRARHGLNNKKIILGVANIWEKRKGLDDLIQLSKKLSDDYKIVIVGKLIGDSLPANMLHVERTDSTKELAEIYSAADVFVNPSYEDNFPTVNIEALACGTPVVTYNTGGSPEAISPSCGIVTEQGNVDELKTAIYSLQETGRRYSTDVSVYNKNVVFAEYVGLYVSLA